MHIFRHPFAVTLVTIILPMVMQLIYIRFASYHIDKSVFGEFVLLQMFVVAMSYVLLQVPTQSYKRFYNSAADKNEFINEFKTLLLFINALCLAAVFLYGVVFSRFSPVVLSLLIFYFWLLSNFSLGQQVFLLKLERERYFYLRVIEAFSKFIMPLIIYSIFKNLESLLVGLVIGYCASTLVVKLFEKGTSYKFIFKVDNIRKYLRFAYPMLFVSFFSWGISFSDRYFIDYFLSTREVGVYAILSTVAGLGTVVGQIYSTYVNPKVLKSYEENRGEALQYLKKSLLVLAVFFVVLCVFALTLPKTVWTILIESEVLEQRQYLFTFYVLMVSVFLAVLQTALSMYLNLFKKLNVLIVVYAAAFTVNFSGNMFIGEYGVAAAAVSTVAAYLIILILQAFLIKRYVRLSS